MKNFFQVVWGTTPKKQGLHDAGLYPVQNEQEKFNINFWISPGKQKKLIKYSQGNFPSAIIGYQIIRGAFHGRFTRIRPLTENWGGGYSEEYVKTLKDIADIIGWHFTFIDGTKAVVKQNPSIMGGASTYDRWRKNNPIWKQKESAKKNWEAYHSFIGDDSKWDESKFLPSEWYENYKNNK